MSACAPDQTNPSDGASTPGEASGSGENESLRTVTFGLQTATNSLPFYLAKEEGFFEEEGINAEFLVYTSGGAQIEAAAVSYTQLDVYKRQTQGAPFSRTSHVGTRRI